MEAKLPFLALLCALLAAGDLWSQVAPASLAAPPAASTSDGPSIDEVVVAMARHASVEAKLRQKAKLFGEQLVGSGIYLQQGQGVDMLVRFELRMQIAGQVGSLLEVGDGRYLWRDWQMPSGRRVSRIVLWPVFTRLAEQSSMQQPSIAPSGGMVVPMGQRLALGGLPKLLAALADNFDFTAGGERRIGDLPVHALWGVWRPDKLAVVLQVPSADTEARKVVDLEKAPEHLPHEVRLLVGRDDLFPYVIEYLGKPLEAAPGAGGGRRQTLVRMELYEVRLGAPIDSRQFVYNPGAIAVDDETEKFLERLVPEKDSRAIASPRTTTRQDAARH